MATDTTDDGSGARLPGIPSGTQARCSWRPRGASTALGLISRIEAGVGKTTRNTECWSAWHARFGRRLRALGSGSGPELAYALSEPIEGAVPPADLATGRLPGLKSSPSTRARPTLEAVPPADLSTGQRLLPSAGRTADAPGPPHLSGDPPPLDPAGQGAALPPAAGGVEAPRPAAPIGRWEWAVSPGRISRGGAYAARVSASANMPVQRRAVPGLTPSPAMRLAILAPAASTESAAGDANADAPLAPRLALSVSPGPRGPRREGYPDVRTGRPTVRVEPEGARPGSLLSFWPAAPEQQEAAEANRTPVPLPATVRPTPPETFAPLADRVPDRTPPAPEPRDAIARLLEQTGLPAPLPGLDLRIVTPEERDRAEAAPEASAWKPPIDRNASGHEPTAPPPLDVEALADRVMQKIERRQKRERERKGLY